MVRNAIDRLRRSRLSNIRFILSAPLAYPPGHFYSPICQPSEIRLRYHDPRDTPLCGELPGIDLRQSGQLALWASWESLLPEARLFGADDASRRYRVPSSNYDVGDAIIYNCMLRVLQPARLTEVGSGSSSAVALDTIERFFKIQPDVTFVEPYPELLLSVLSAEDKRRARIIRSPVQAVPVATFRALERNDILFIDSTHIVKTGSDVVYELFDILPSLASGVVVHFHDVFYPFEYPPEWAIERNYSWNEIYALRAFLTGNPDWEILFFNDYFVRAERDLVARQAPEVLRNPGGGLWLRRR